MNEQGLQTTTGLGPKLFQRFCDLAYSRAGIRLAAGKESLVATRVAKRLRALNLKDPKSYLSYLENDSTGNEIVHFLDVISTNFTSFFREKDHFTILTQMIEEDYGRGQRRFRLWSAASSSGEEPYSMAITLLEALAGREKSCDIRILATDISTRMLERAGNGVYEGKALGELSAFLRSRYFEERFEEGRDERRYGVTAAVKSLVLYKRLNLSSPPFPMVGPLDIVFCRNVMIYFDQPVRQRLIAEIERLLRPGGLLLIGHTETLSGIQCGLQLEKPSVYRKPAG